MKNKSEKIKPKGTLIRGEMIPITDPAEQADLDRRCREAEKAMAAAQTGARRTKQRKGK